jgi:hypothetical protein
MVTSVRETHEMVLNGRAESGAEEWVCPDCGRRVLMRWPPDYERLILEHGDDQAVHVGAKGGVRMTGVEVNPSPSPGMGPPPHEGRTCSMIPSLTIGAMSPGSSSLLDKAQHRAMLPAGPSLHLAGPDVLHPGVADRAIVVQQNADDEAFVVLPVSCRGTVFRWHRDSPLPPLAAPAVSLDTL